jgi:DNA mismatch repair protein MutL
MGIIRLLPENIANQIAAGEVVQRPASVVKELLENAVDAGAKHIKLIVKDGGKSLIQVVDDGTGMDETDARLSFERHATSKIKTSEDLFRITTKGFRGEALASIAAVSQVEMKTRPHDKELGTLIKIEGGAFKVQEPVQTPAGTSVAVKNLFFNVPARRKFLKSQQVEMRHIIDEFQRVALAYPEIEFTLIHNGNEVYRLFPSNLLRRITSVFGGKMEERLLPLNEDTEYIKIYGYTGKPEFAKLKRGEQFFFVNKRFIKSAFLHSAVMKAYEGLLQEKKIPSYFIYFEIAPEHIDINIHPTKTEIKFDDEYTVYNILRASTRRALGQFNQMPSIDFDRMPELNLTAPKRKASINREPKINVNPDFNPFKSDTAPFAKPVFDKTSKKAVENYLEFIKPPAHTENELTSNKELFHQNEITAENENFQWQDKYIVTSTRQGIIIINQHDAHVSILFDEFYGNLRHGNIPSQQLMFPLNPDLLASEAELIDKNKTLFERAGFAWTSKDGNLMFTAVPAGINDKQTLDFIENMIAALSEDLPTDEDEINRFLAMKLALSAAIRPGQKLTAGERQNLIARLFALPRPEFTPSGKRNFIILSENQIDKLF